MFGNAPLTRGRSRPKNLTQGVKFFGSRPLVSTRVLLRRALALAVLVPTLAGAAPQSQRLSVAASARHAPPSQRSSPAASARQAPEGLPPALATRFSEGVAALSSGQLDSAEAAFRDVIRNGGDKAFVRHNLGIVLQQRGRHADALVEFRAASRFDPAFGPSHLLTGTSLLALGQPKAALAELGLASRLMPREPAVHLQRADACERINDVVCLADEYRTLVELSPANSEYAYRLGKAYLRLSQWAHARIQAIDPRAARLSQALGREYLEQGRADLAERAFNDAIGRDATLADVHLALARIYLGDGRLDEAARAVARVLVLVPDSKDARALQAKIEAVRTPR
jgi:predicted Zn-dependent protease